MIRISEPELKAKAGKHVAMATDQDGLITQDGKVAAKLVPAEADKKEALQHFLGLFLEEGRDFDPERAREERLV